ncbi:hypothetical protein CAOG_009945 [Capsaspora owczarzaki ATCC 30864]|uniref:Uncharacterized protein n=1 Tax=Capsaspora owczarzaki (strain ATCC 30864) TaxID=595528 RepID=A0A0D2UKT2_CAPO3|nr:hypothetical protein CAOG_009945 [Capsaspora owczarzaki ATCC 30864]
MDSLYANGISNIGVQVICEAYKINGMCDDLDGDGQINFLAFSLRPRRVASAEDPQTVFDWLISGPTLQDQSTSLPALPAEIAERVLDEAYYWQGVQHTKRADFDDGSLFHTTDGTADRVLKVTVPHGMDGHSIRVKAIQVLRDWRKRPNITSNHGFNLIVRDEQGAVRSEFAVKPTLIDTTLDLAMIWPASHSIIREIRAGWQVHVRPSDIGRDAVFESLYLGYVEQ